MQLLLGILALLAIAAAVLLLVGFAVAAMKRGARHGSAGIGNAVQELEGLFVESKKHVIREMRAEEGEEEPGSGDPPVKS